MRNVDQLNQELGKAVERQQAIIEERVKAAFEKHFGFPLEDVEDKSLLERYISTDNPDEIFRYMGEDFLHMTVEIKFDPYKKNEFCVVTRYREL